LSRRPKVDENIDIVRSPYGPRFFTAEFRILSRELARNYPNYMATAARTALSNT